MAKASDSISFWFLRNLAWNQSCNFSTSNLTLLRPYHKFWKVPYPIRITFAQRGICVRGCLGRSNIWISGHLDVRTFRCPNVQMSRYLDVDGIDQSIDRSIHWSVDRWIYQSVDRLIVGGSFQRSCVHRSINRMSRRPMDRSIDQSLDQLEIEVNKALLTLCPLGLREN